MSISITKKEDGAHESEIDELCKAEDKYFRDFLKALFRVDQRYIMWVHEGKVYKHVERVFAYELYHQFRKIMEIEENKLRYEEVFLNGETFKEGSLHGKLSKCFSSCYPDLVLHKDLMDNNTEGQYLLCEMKTSENPYIINELKEN